MILCGCKRVIRSLPRYLACNECSKKILMVVEEEEYVVKLKQQESLHMYVMMYVQVDDVSLV